MLKLVFKRNSPESWVFLNIFTSLWCIIMHWYAISGMLVKGQWANVNLTCPLKSGSGFKVKGRRHVFFTTDQRKKSLFSLTEAPWTQIASDHITGLTIVILHAYHHPLTPAKCSSAPSIHCLDRHQSFKGISSSCFELYLLPPLNTAGESQDSAAVAENYLWWEICEGNECREKGKGKKTCKEIRDRKIKFLALNIYTFAFFGLSLLLLDIAHLWQKK